MNPEFRLRAAGGLTEPVDQENVENFAARNQAASDRLGGIGIVSVSKYLIWSSPLA